MGVGEGEWGIRECLRLTFDCYPFFGEVGWLVSKVFGEGGLLHLGTEDYCFWGLLHYFTRVTGCRVTGNRLKRSRVK